MEKEERDLIAARMILAAKEQIDAELAHRAKLREELNDPRFKVYLAAYHNTFQGRIENSWPVNPSFLSRIEKGLSDLDKVKQ